MSPEPVQALLEALCRGEQAAAEKVFLHYEPYLRQVVRRQLPAHLRTKFDSLDVVQSAWADLLSGFCEAGWRFPSAASLRAFLVRVTRNRFLDRVRQHHTALDREVPVQTPELAALASAEPRPSEQAQAEELWEKMMSLCPPEHHELLRLRRQGFSLGEIAGRTGLHEGSVRRILRALARRGAFRVPNDPPTGEGPGA